MSPGRRRAFLSLLAWLGPWSAARGAPRGVTRRMWVVREGEARGRRARREGDAGWRGRSLAGDQPTTRLEALVLEPEGPILGTYVVAPGLHFDGPADPRFERFCLILAHAGFRVVAAFLPSYLELLVQPEAADDLELVTREVARLLAFGERLTLFSISFGSWPALEVAARMPEHVDAVVTFGGYADFHAAVRFCVDGVMRTPDGDVQLAQDPLNPPALFVNLLPWLGVPEPEHGALAEAWREVTYRTWGQGDLKAAGKLAPIVESVCAEVPPAHRELFRVGCGVRPGTAALVGDALARAGDAFDFASPRGAIRALSCPVVVCHGRDDDVIPVHEAEKLHAALKARGAARLYLTGLYDHTGAGWPSARAAVSEVGTLLGIARVLAAGGAVRELVR